MALDDANKDSVRLVCRSYRIEHQKGVQRIDCNLFVVHVCRYSRSDESLNPTKCSLKVSGILKWNSFKKRFHETNAPMLRHKYVSTASSRAECVSEIERLSIEEQRVLAIDCCESPAYCDHRRSEASYTTAERNLVQDTTKSTAQESADNLGIWAFPIAFFQ